MSLCVRVDEFQNSHLPQDLFVGGHFTDRPFIIKILSVLSLTFFTLATYAQGNIPQYLKTYHFSFSLDKGFDQPTTDILKRKLSSYRLIL
jgi:hypothetical protein